MKRKIELVGADPCWSDPKQVYPTDKSNWELGKGDIRIIVDQYIPKGLELGGKKYAWLYEPTAVIQSIVNHIKNNLDLYMNEYEKIFTHNEELANMHERIILVYPGFPSWIKEPHIHNKNKLVSMITSFKYQTEGHRLRMRTASKLQSKLDLFGREVNPIENKEEALNDYMFSVSVENDNTDTVFTEKLLDCFMCGTIPIYWGSKKVLEHFDGDGIIWLEDFNIDNLSEEVYNSKLESIKNNFETAIKINKGIPEMLDIFVDNYIEKEDKS
tara:strand:+ start:1526 stop:2338 length:813 start_codon:yes stop_codon:yes gene_type:complete